MGNILPIICKSVVTFLYISKGRNTLKALASPRGTLWSAKLCVSMHSKGKWWTQAIGAHTNVYSHCFCCSKYCFDRYSKILTVQQLDESLLTNMAKFWIKGQFGRQLTCKSEHALRHSACTARSTQHRNLHLDQFPKTVKLIYSFNTLWKLPLNSSQIYCRQRGLARVIHDAPKYNLI